MKTLNLKIYLYIIVIISIVLLFLIAHIMDIDISNVLHCAGIIPKVLTIDIIIIFLFIKWGWRCKYFYDWLVPFPNLNGTWEGTIQSNWKKPSGESIAPIPAILVINQSFFNISCTMYTQEMTSYSYSESFFVDKERHIKQLCYLYGSKPRISVQERSPVHEGAITFDIIGANHERLVGEYWTKRLTAGEINLTFKCQEKFDCFPNDMPPHPMQSSG